MVRNESFELCKQIPIEELLRRRVGGVGSILHTLIHVIDAERRWVRGIMGKPDNQLQYEDYDSLQQVKQASDTWSNESLEFLKTWTSDFENEVVTVPWSNRPFTKGDILHHVIAHEIHHIGQLSIWIRELGLQPAPANFVGRDLSKYL